METNGEMHQCQTRHNDTISQGSHCTTSYTEVCVLQVCVSVSVRTAASTAFLFAVLGAYFVT